MRGGGGGMCVWGGDVSNSHAHAQFLVFCMRMAAGWRLRPRLCLAHVFGLRVAWPWDTPLTDYPCPLARPTDRVLATDVAS